MYNEDYILRMFEQIADVAAHLLGFHTIVEIAQLNRRGDHDQALAAIDRAWDDLHAGPRKLILEARAIAPDDQDDAALRELASAVPRAALAPRYQALLPQGL